MWAFLPFLSPQQPALLGTSWESHLSLRHLQSSQKSAGIKVSHVCLVSTTGKGCWGKKSGRQRYKKAIPNISLASPLAPSLLRYLMAGMAVSTMDSASTTTRTVGAAVSSSCFQGGICLGWRKCLSWQCLICGTWLSTTPTSPSCTCAKKQLHHLCVHNLKLRWGPQARRRQK